MAKSYAADWRFGLGCLILITCTNAPEAVRPAFAAASEPTAKALEKIIASENWPEIVRNLHLKPSYSYPEKFLLAHAYLALNRNNESTCGFVDLETETAIRSWHAWAIGFAARNPNLAVANYLLGDSLARLERWDDAAAALDRAIKSDPRHSLALNARGTIRTAQGRYDVAGNDFEDAAAADPDFADALASRGTLNVLRSSGAKGAVRWFEQALMQSAQFGLAFNGRGAARFGLGPNHWAAAQTDFATAASLLSCTANAVLNLRALEVAQLKWLDRDMKRRIAEATPGTSIHSKLNAMNNSVGSDIARQIYANRAYFDSTRNLIKRKFRSDVAGGILRLFERVAGGLSLAAGAYALKGNVRSGVVAFGAAGAEAVSKYWANHLGRTSDRYRKDINTFIGGHPPGGAEADPSTAYQDVGNWPVGSFFGLVYFVKPKGQ